MEPVRICCFCLQWSHGGIESFLSSSLLNIGLDGIEADIVAPVIENSPLTEKLLKSGIGLYPLSGRRWAVFENGRRFARLIRERRYTAVHFNLYEAFSLCYLVIAKGMGIKTRIVHAHQSGLRKTPLRPLKLLIHRTFSAALSGYATERWACSEQAGEFFFPRNMPFEVISNGIDTTRFKFDPLARERLRVKLNLGDRPVIGAVGRLSGEKNYPFLLELFSLLCRRLDNPILLIVGSGEELSSLKRAAKRLKIADSVIFFGETEYPEQLLSAMDILILPSLVEGFGRVAVESQINGLFTLCSENVAAEAGISPLFCQIPLSSGAEHWAEKAEQGLNAHFDRAGYADIAADSGFGIESTVKSLKEAYLRR